MDVASMKLKQDVESSWQCPFVSVSKEESEAQHAFCNVKKEKRKWRIPHIHTACTRFLLRSRPQNDPREDSASCFSIRAASAV